MRPVDSCRMGKAAPPAALELSRIAPFVTATATICRLRMGIDQAMVAVFPASRYQNGGIGIEQGLARNVKSSKRCDVSTSSREPAFFGADAMNRLALQGLNILVVDDDPRVRGLYGIVLREAGAVVTASGTAKEAVQLAELHPPDVVVTDVRMPGHDGIWLLHQLKSRMPTIPVIVVTGAPDAPSLDELQRLGFAEILRKPVVLSRLAATVAHVARRSG
jgi:CheY-like chemotaxis protein